MRRRHTRVEARKREDSEFDFIVVGSGAGGGPLAARLALNGRRVLVIEAGGNHTAPPTGPDLEVTQVPSFHGRASEHPDLSWQFFVKHYDEPPTGADPKWDEAHGGIFYPRAAALGGCTIHNAMITIAGPDSDWDELADTLNDESWSGAQMRPYFQKLEHNDYSPLPTSLPTTWWGHAWEELRWLFGFDPDHTRGRHGFNGWLHTSFTDVSLGRKDKRLIKMLTSALIQSKRAGLERAGTLVRRFLRGEVQQPLDPNHARTQAESPEGVVLIPLAVCGDRTTIHQNREQPFVRRGARSGPREFLLEAQAKYPENLTIWTDCFVTEVLFDDRDGLRAIGVALRKGKNLYKAHPEPNSEGGEACNVFVKDPGEVILCGGAFNTPQLLMLSGIGEREQLAEHDIECRVHSPGVGKNLQDRYEVTVISEMDQDFSLLDDATFDLPEDPHNPDKHLRQWRQSGTGLYTSNGGVLGIFKRSNPDLPQPDLFIFGVPLPFKGYELGYSNIGDIHNKFTWTILKAHTQNRDGAVELRSDDPLDTPAINFHYFNERSRPDQTASDVDVAAIVEGVKFVRDISRNAKFVVKESHPGSDEVPNDDEQINQWVRRVAWGHHACGTCRMGPDDDASAVLDHRFRVRGEPNNDGVRKPIQGLRVVDASIFPKIPGYFIVTNIYMASEKAADVIDEDFMNTPPDDVKYPRGLRAKEAAAVNNRRVQVPPDEGAPVLDSVGTEQWPDDVTGLAISGGGIRSATLGLGILQAMGQKHWLRRIDFLSTVSGGGYIGSFLGRFFDRLHKDAEMAAGDGSSESATQRVEHELADPNSPLLDWLRKHGNYIAPQGKGDWRVGIAVFLRNLLSVHFVIGLLLFAVFGLANAIRYGLFDPATAGLGLVLMDKGDLPLGALLQALLGPFFSPWFMLFEIVLLFLVLPRIIGYWIVSPNVPNGFHCISLILLYLCVTVLLLLGVHQSVYWPLLLSLALLSSFISVEMAWRRGREREDAVGSGGAEGQRARTRNYLTYDLALTLALAGAVFVFAFIDTLAHGLQQWLIEKNVSYAAAFATIGAALTALIPVLRLLANVVISDDESTKPPSTIKRILKKQISAGLLAAVLFLLPLVVYSFAAHAVYQGGSQLGMGIFATLLALILSVLLRHPKALTFVNRSSLSQLYAARLARAYLGASNPARHRPDGANITEVIAGDDVASIRDYRPHMAGGPLHLINVVVNQTVDFTSQHGNRDRQGENLAVSCLGVSLGERWHSLWGSPSSNGTQQSAGRRWARLEPVGHLAGTDHPLVDETGQPASRAEMLSLRQWMAISGAAVGPGRGQITSLGTALLLGLANVRTGYWWDSGITEAEREGFPKLTFLRRGLYLIPRFLRTQGLLLFEWIARFAGPWERFWNLSDGGFFENTGGYELVRRRVPRMILCDGSADPTYNFEIFAELVRKVRIDFDACITPFSDEDLQQHVPESVRDYVGTAEELKAVPGGHSSKHAALYWVNYETDPARKSVILLLKATLTSDESSDIQHYQAAHPEFPHEATEDQVFDEAQWESYRKLGQHIASPLMEDKSWFWNIPLT